MRGVDFKTIALWAATGTEECWLPPNTGTSHRGIRITGSQAERGCLATSDSATFPVTLAALCAHSAGFLSEFPSLGPLPELEDIGLRHVQLARDVAGSIHFFSAQR